MTDDKIDNETGNNIEDLSDTVYLNKNSELRSTSGSQGCQPIEIDDLKNSKIDVSSRKLAFEGGNKIAESPRIFHIKKKLRKTNSIFQDNQKFYIGRFKKAASWGKFTLRIKNPPSSASLNSVPI